MARQSGGLHQAAPAVVTPFYVAAAILVAAQVLGIYGLVTRKADFTFALVMLVLVLLAIAAGIYGLQRAGLISL